MSAARLFIAAVAIGAVAVRGETCAEVVADTGAAIIPEGTLTIAAEAFLNCDALKSITVPASVTALGNSAFQGSGLERFKLAGGSQIESLGEQTFADCAALKKISIPKTVQTLDGASFDNSGLDNLIFDVKSLQNDKNNLVFYKDRSVMYP
eukprot:CAMPEP_0194322668 /NCGR_PEP_ID=MMETSP0171-20130528/22208_1 /TAXON_ID=218684 /ORGANISM="Corethron pennatum, Strain L29A3" /LENGTH=150 /DNA_ID=CAMNT_0039081019 /DNA_START=167 /DNA_END=619 /DNA_ORIENTATION=+